MTDALDPTGQQTRQRAAAAQLKRRYARERRFKLYGQLAIGIALAFLLLLVGRIFEQGHTAFYTHALTTPVYLDPARVDRVYPSGANYLQLAADQQAERLGVADDPVAVREVRDLLSSELNFVAAAAVEADPSRIGQTLH